MPIQHSVELRFIALAMGYLPARKFTYRAICISSAPLISNEDHRPLDGWPNGKWRWPSKPRAAFNPLPFPMGRREGEVVSSNRDTTRGFGVNPYTTQISQPATPLPE